jgi:hypothetical protein
MAVSESTMFWHHCHVRLSHDYETALFGRSHNKVWLGIILLQLVKSTAGRSSMMVDEANALRLFVNPLGAIVA